MSEKREGNLFYDKESGRYDLEWNPIMEVCIAESVLK